MEKNLVRRVLFNGTTQDAKIQDKSKAALFNSFSSILALLLVIFTVVDIIQEKYVVAAVTTITALLIVLSIVIVTLSKKLLVGTTMICYITFILAALLVYTSGYERAGYFWCLFFPFVSIFFLGFKHGSILTTLYGILFYFLIYHIPSFHNIPVNEALGLRAISSYIGITGLSVTFEIIRYRTFNKLEKTSSDLVTKRKQTEMILDNVKQGIFLLDENLNLEDERSEYFNTLFTDVDDNHSFLDLINNKLPERDFVATKDYLELFFNKTVNPTLLSSINPVDKVLMNFTGHDGEIKQTWLEFDFERIILKSGSVQILGLFRDVTDRVILEQQLEREESESSKNMENLFQIIHVNPELMDEFIKDSEDEIEKINELLRVESEDTIPIINYIFSSIHSIKGNALLLGLTNMGKKLHDFEEYIKELKLNIPTWRELLQLTVNLAELKHDISGIKELITKIISFQSTIGSTSQNRKFIMAETLKKSVDKLIADTDKHIKINIDDYNIDDVPEKYRRLFKDSITQLIRNSVAHGIEDSNDRVKKNKSPHGNIHIKLKVNSNKLEFIYRDDGNGLCVEKIKEAAISKKGFTEDQVNKLKASDAVKLIFHPGFSTANEVDSVAGQGIGMNVVKNHVDSAGGKLNIKSSVGNFCEFKILLPV